MYIAPMKALVRERVDDWNRRMERGLGKRVVELTGDSSPDIRAIERADVIVTTPEKWDGISRSWQNRLVICVRWFCGLPQRFLAYPRTYPLLQSL